MKNTYLTLLRTLLALAIGLGTVELTSGTTIDESHCDDAPLKSSDTRSVRTGLILVIHQKTWPSYLNYSWDHLRGWIAWANLRRGYNKIYYVFGAQLNDTKFMQTTWEKAIQENDQIDYFSFVHAGDQHLNLEKFGIDKNKVKLRAVYSEACHGGSGRDEFLKYYRGVASAGHGWGNEGTSFSPYFSLFFLYYWAKGQSFQQSLQSAWQKGAWLLSSKAGYSFAQKMAGYKSIDEALEHSRIHIAYGDDSPAEQLFIHTPIQREACASRTLKEQAVHDN